MSLSLIQILPLTGVAASIAALFYCRYENDYGCAYEHSKQSRSLRESLWRLRYSRVKMLKHPACVGISLMRGTDEAFMRLYQDFQSGKNQPEYIVAAAIQHPSGLIYAAAKPGRHHHCIRIMDAQGKAGLGATRKQGFITSAGRFVIRREALAIAYAADQVRFKHPVDYELYSEDMW